jgi:hypothetical protein
MRWTLLILLLAGSRSLATVLPDFKPTTEFSEQQRWETTAEGVRLYFNAAQDFDPHKKTELILYLLPNGNTIDQTLGRRLTPGLDWHFDIQHIAAQVRLLRKLDTSENKVLCCLEAPGRSWPKFRADHPDNPQRIRNLVTLAESALPPTDIRIALVAHSGGGSFLIGYLNSGSIDDSIDRFVFLDANYSYSDELHHGDKLLDWMHRSPLHRLIVFAYDDRNITLNGKKIVSDTGGTWRASQRMMLRLTQEQKADANQVGPFLHYSFLGGQAQFFLHPNPQQKILHTFMIGEMNAFLHALTLGTPYAGKYGTLGGPRAYTDYVGNAVTVDPSPPVILNLPARPTTAPTGSQFLKTIEPLPTDQREPLVITEILSGNMPPFLRNLKPITVSAKDPDGTDHTASYYVTPDVLAVGSDLDFFRMPLTPVSAEKLAGSLGCSLITRKISDDIYQHSDMKLAPMPLTIKREAPDTFYQSNQLIEDERKGKPLGLLVAGIKKDVVLTNRLNGREGHVAIYGWHKLDGKAIQPLYVGHLETYVDYSHGIRLIADTMIVDDKPTTVQAVLVDPKLSILLSDEGPIIPPHYSPTTHPTTKPTTKP